MRPLLSFVRLALGLLVFAAIGQQLGIHVSLDFSVINFFSYFTNISNLFAAAIFVAGARRGFRGQPATAVFDQLRFLSAVNMAIVGIVFSLLLRNVDLGSLLPWINTLLHYVTPCVVVLDWFIDPPVTKLGQRQLWRIEVFPGVYLGYVLIRGSTTGFYPYPFLNPATVGGYGAVAGYAATIALTFLIAGWVLMKVRLRSA